MNILLLFPVKHHIRKHAKTLHFSGQNILSILFLDELKPMNLYLVGGMPAPLKI